MAEDIMDRPCTAAEEVELLQQKKEADACVPMLKLLARMLRRSGLAPVYLGGVGGVRGGEEEPR